MSSWPRWALPSLLVQALLVGLLAAAGLHTQRSHNQHVLLPEFSCVTETQPNPLHGVYPNNATGVLNTTLAIVPIPLKKAREIIPSQYGILEHAYRALIPDFPEDMYPMLVQAGNDHDIRYMSYSIPDFNRVGYEFPFLDILGDGYSVFRWAPEQMITETNSAAVEGSRAYGTVVHPATFEPECDAFASSSSSSSSSSPDDDDGNTYFKASANDIYMSLAFQRNIGSTPLYPLSVFKNITNQPIFAGGSQCDQQIRLFDTPLSKDHFDPVPVRGSIDSNMGPFKTATSFQGVSGYQICTPFIENNYLACESLKGYEGSPISGEGEGTGRY